MLSHVERNNCLLMEKIFLSNYPLPSTHLSVTVASRGSPSNLLSLSSGSSSLSPYARKHKAREWAISALFTDFRAIKADNQYICGDYRWCCSWERGSCDRGVDNRDKSLIIDLYRTIFQSICDLYPTIFQSICEGARGVDVWRTRGVGSLGLSKLPWLIQVYLVAHAYQLCVESTRAGVLESKVQGPASC